MIICRQEEPLRPNPDVLMFDEQAERYVPSTIGNPHLNRYHLVWRADHDGSAPAFARLGRLMLQEVRTDALWLQAWMTSGSGAGRYYLHQLRRRKAAAGWTIQEFGVATCANRRITTIPDTSLWPSDHSWKDGGICMLMGCDCLSTCTQLEMATPTIQQLAYTKQLAPSSRFLDWLVINSASVVYDVHDHYSDRPGLIVIGVHRFAVATWLRAGAIDRIDVVHANESASQTFTSSIVSE